MQLVLSYLMPAIAMVLGAYVGSFLNVVIQSLPKGIKVKGPERSFCPNCGSRLKIPVLSWLLQKGKCRGCHGDFKTRYFVVEILTALVFLGIWLLFFQKIGLTGVLALGTLAALMLAANFIDLDHLILPDSITLGGIAAGILFSLGAPAIHETTSWIGGLFDSLFGAIFGFVLLWLIAVGAKLKYGVITHDFQAPVDFTISQPGGEKAPILIKLGAKYQYEWQDVFYRAWDRLKLATPEVMLNGELRPVKKQFAVSKNGFLIDGVKTRLNQVGQVSGKCSQAIVPQEVVGFGNVKFVAMIGAFLGWQAVLVASLLAFCSVPLIRLYFKRSKVPFSPFLTLGTLIYMACLL